jgi:hypothetical protein
MRAPMVMAVAMVTGMVAVGPVFAQGTWNSLKPIPQGEEEVYGTTAGGKLYVLGGLGIFPGWEPKQMLWSFDPATNEWTKLPNIPEGIHHPGFASVGDKLYSIGGFTIARPATGLPHGCRANRFGFTTSTPRAGRRGRTCRRRAAR